MSDFNILTDPFFPVVTVTGARRWLRFAELAQEDGDFPVQFGWPRGDLNIACHELCIGLLALMHQPQQDSDWREIWEGGCELVPQERIEFLAPFFNLFGGAEGKGPRFMQDFEPLQGEANAIEALFIDTPGANGQKKNADLLTHRERFPALGYKAAAMALYALQQFAPSGGAGNRTSLRGGGPMTTLALPLKAMGTDGEVAQTPLWRTLLANLPLLPGNTARLSDEEIARALPWAARALTSDGKPPLELSEADAKLHPLQAFFGMPRRVRLVAEGEGVCTLTGEAGPLVTGFVQNPWGMNYGLWSHPMTPYRRAKDSDPPYSVKPKSARLHFRDWAGAAFGWSGKKGSAMRAACIEDFNRRNDALKDAGYRQARLLACGWAMNNMEAETFLQSVQPFYLADQRVAKQLGEQAWLFAEAAETAVSSLRFALNLALFDGQAKSTDAGLFADASDSFFAATEGAFHQSLDELQNGPAADPDEAKKRWLTALRRAALTIYHAHASAQLAGKPDIKRAERVNGGYRTVVAALAPEGKIAKEMGMPISTVPKTAKTSRKQAGKAGS